MKNVEHVQFRSTDNLLLPGLLYEPVRKTKKVLVYLHGNGSSSVFYNPLYYEEIAKALNQKSISFLAFNNRGAHIIKSLKKVRGKKGKSVMMGTAFELIKDCVKDIDGAVKFLRSRGYSELYLAGLSTGANKVCVYNYLTPNNHFKKYILLGGADDTGLMYKRFGKRKFFELLKESKLKSKKKGRGDFLPFEKIDAIYSYQSLFDTINPDGYYNTFPFLETFTRITLSRKKLFREFKTIRKPTLVLYGEKDEYAIGGAEEDARVLKSLAPNPNLVDTSVIPQADHGFHGKEKQLAKVIADWL